MAEALKRNRADLNLLADAGHGDLLDRFRRAVTAAELAGREGPSPDNLPAMIGSHRDRGRVVAELADCVDAIRRLRGLHDFLKPLSFDQVQRLAAGGPLVYLVVTSAGGVGLVATAGGAELVRLPCTADEVIRFPGIVFVFPSRPVRMKS